MENPQKEYNTTLKPWLLTQGAELGKADREGNPTAKAINYYYSQLKKDFSLEIYESLKNYADVWKSQYSILLRSDNSQT